MQELHLVYQVPRMDQVSLRKDITYKTVDGVDLNLDVYLPPDLDESAALPAVVFVHGAAPGWPPFAPVEQRIKDWAVYQDYGRLIAALGFAAVTFNHRGQEQFTNLAGMAAVVADIDDFLTYIRDNAASLHIDNDRLAVWSISTGCPFGVSAAAKHAGGFVRCIVAYYGPLDLRSLAPDVSESDLQPFSPVQQLSEGWPPTFVARAELDQIMGTAINDSIDAFVSEARAKNLDVEVINHPQGQHAFDVLNNDARSREIIQRTLEFVKAHLER